MARKHVSPLIIYSHSTGLMIMLITGVTILKRDLVRQAHSVAKSLFILSECDGTSNNVAGTVQL